MKLLPLLAAGLGGAAGSMLRYAVSHFFTVRATRMAPLWGTFTVNIAGCLLIGLLFGLAQRYGWLTPSLRALLMAGFCGGFTTFSAFALENVTLLQDGHYGASVLYVLASAVFCIGATFAGMLLAKI